MSLEGNATAGYVLEGKITGVPRVDDTLTKEGWCADAKATGDRLARLEGYKDDAEESAQSAIAAAEIAQRSAEEAKAYAGERFDELAEDVDTLKTDVEALKNATSEGGGSSSGGDSGGSSSSGGTTPGGSYDDSEITERVDGIEMRVENVEGDMATVNLRADNIENRVEDAEGNLSMLDQRATGLETRVQDTEGNISTLQQTATGLASRVSQNEKDIDSNADKYSEIRQTVDNISFTVSDPINGGTNRYVTITLTIDGNEHTGVVMIDGNVDISGQLSAEALYATLGDIARLKVDSLSTSRRIPKYLAGDESDDNYIDIQDQHISLKWATTDGTYKQARDDFGAYLYWEQDIEGAELGDDGYPYVDGARVFITTEETDWPVMVYRYEEAERLQIYFVEEENFGPRMVWGWGDGTSSGKGRGYLEKLGLSYDIYNLGTDGVKRGVFMDNEFTHITGLPKPSKIVFGENTVKVTMNDGYTETLTFTKDTAGNITKITDSSGHVTEVE